MERSVSTMTQADKARALAALHTPGSSLVLYNCWDAGSPKAVAKFGALVTGSWSVVAAQGYADGQQIPLDFVLRIMERIVATVSLPLTVDFEGCYAIFQAEVAANVSRVVEAEGIGINFEDKVVGGSGLHSVQEQAARIAAAREGSARVGVTLFTNARTDLFLQQRDASRRGDLPREAIEQAGAYGQAGASGFFVPGLIDPDNIRAVREVVTLLLNILMMPGAPSLKTIAELGVARVSYGPGIYRQSMRDLTETAGRLH